MNLPAGTRRYPPLWIYWRRNSAVLTAAQSWCTAACLLLPSPPTWSCDCRDNSWHHSYKIRALGCRGLFILWFSYLFLNSFDSQLYSCPCFSVSLFLCLPVLVSHSLSVSEGSFSFFSHQNDSQPFPQQVHFSLSHIPVFQVSVMLPSRLLRWHFQLCHCQRGDIHSSLKLVCWQAAELPSLSSLTSVQKHKLLKIKFASSDDTLCLRLIQNKHFLRLHHLKY